MWEGQVWREMAVDKALCVKGGEVKDIKTSVEALTHREVTLVLSSFPCMHVSLLYQARSLEDQLQLQEAANHQHRYRVYWFTLTRPIAITC